MHINKEFFFTKVSEKHNIPTRILLFILFLGLVGFLINTTVLIANEGLMPIENVGLNVNALELTSHHTVATRESKLLFLSANILIDTRWLRYNSIPNGIRFIAEIIGYGPAGIYVISIGDSMMMISSLGMIILFPIMFLYVYFFIPIKIFLRK